MLKSSALALILVAGAAGGALAQTQANDALSPYDVSQFETRTMQVAVATDRQSGRRFNVVKLPNGRMMVLLASEKLSALSPFADDSEMMYSGHGGTAR